MTSRTSLPPIPVLALKVQRARSPDKKLEYAGNLFRKFVPMLNNLVEKKLGEHELTHGAFSREERKDLLLDARLRMAEFLLETRSLKASIYPVVYSTMARYMDNALESLLREPLAEAQFHVENAPRHLPSPLESAEFENLRKDVASAISTLGERDRKIICMLYGIGTGRAHTDYELVKVFHITRTRISQLEAKALLKLRRPAIAKTLRQHYDPSSEFKRHLVKQLHSIMEMHLNWEEQQVLRMRGISFGEPVYSYSQIGAILSLDEVDVKYVENYAIGILAEKSRIGAIYGPKMDVQNISENDHAVKLIRRIESERSMWRKP